MKGFLIGVFRFARCAGAGRGHVYFRLLFLFATGLETDFSPDVCFATVFFAAVAFAADFLLPPSFACNTSTKSLGRLALRIPACWNAVIFSAAVADAPEMIAPACPILRPGGAVWPAMNPSAG